MARFRIAHIVTQLGVGAQSTLYTVAHLNRTLFEPHLLAGAGGLLDEEAEAIGNFHHCGELNRPMRPLADHQAFQQLKEKIRHLRPDIVHTHGAKAGVLGRLAASVENVAVIVHTYHEFAFHRYQTEGVFRLSAALEREASRRSKHLIFVSWENAKWAEQLELVQNCSTSLLRNGVEVEPLLKARRSEDLRDELGIPPRGKAVAMIASLKTQKDPLTFLEAANLVIRKRHNVKFFMIGDGELAAAVVERASKLVHTRNFVHLGWRRDIPQILPSFDLVVVPSLWEGLPTIIPEATIAGVPVIASDIDGIREVVFQGRNGELAEPRNPEDFAEKILKAVDQDWTVDPDLARQIQHEFDIREMVRKQEEIYLRLAA